MNLLGLDRASEVRRALTAALTAATACQLVAVELLVDLPKELDPEMRDRLKRAMGEAAEAFERLEEKLR